MFSTKYDTNLNLSSLSETNMFRKTDQACQECLKNQQNGNLHSENPTLSNGQKSIKQMFQSLWKEQGQIKSKVFLELLERISTSFKLTIISFLPFSSIKTSINSLMLILILMLSFCVQSSFSKPVDSESAYFRSRRSADVTSSVVSCKRTFLQTSSTVSYD